VSEHPIAFVDEAFIQRPNHPGGYLFAAVLVDRDELTVTVDAAVHAAGGHGDYHTTGLYQRGHIRPIEDMLDTIETYAGWTALVVQAPIGGSGQAARETARQAALSRLLQHLNTQKVRDVVLDTRASEREQLQTQLEGRKITRSDLPDIHTYRKLVRNHEISPRMRLLHVDDRKQPALWMADAAAWAFQRALVFDEPQWWSRIAAVSTVLDAGSGAELALQHNRAAPPIGERGPRNPSQSAQASLLQPQFYTLNGGTTNRSHGPGYLYTGLLQQIDAASTPAEDRQLTEQIAELAKGVAALTTAIQSISNLEPTATTAQPAHELTNDVEPDSDADHGREPTIG